MQLYPFQEADIAKIVRQTSGLIGSEMGTGKTIEAIKLDAQWWEDSKKPTLIVAPLNTFDGWQKQYGIWAPDNDVTIIDRKNRGKFVDAIRRKRGDVFVMHYDALRLMPELQRFDFGTIILDEVHRIANRKSQVFQAVKMLDSHHQLGMSGTASGDQPQNLWSILNWLWPTFYKSYWAFRKHYCVEEKQYNADGEAGYTKIVGVQNISHLMEQMSPWYVRHLKRDQCCNEHPNGVMPWLKPKTYDTIWVDLTPKQRKVYEQMKKEMVAWVGEHEDSPLVAQAAITQLARLSQIALAHPVVSWKQVPVVDEDKNYRYNADGTIMMQNKLVVDLEEPSAKLDVIVELLKDHPEKKFVIASASKKFIYLMRDRFARVGIGCFVLTGDTPQHLRNGMAERFQHDNVQAFIGVIDAMAEGIDGLQYATDTMIFADRSWKTIKNQQCEDRLDRDGQSEGVQIIDIMARHTLDLGRKQKLDTKWSWIRTILGDKFDNVQEAEAA